MGGLEAQVTMDTKMIRAWSVVVLFCWLFASAMVPAYAGPPQQDGMPELVYGQTIDGQLASEQPSMFYLFSAETGDVVTITMIATEGDLDPFLVLNDASRTPLSTDDNSGGGVNARLTFVIPAAGQYIIQATHAGDSRLGQRGHSRSLQPGRRAGRAGIRRQQHGA